MNRQSLKYILTAIFLYISTLLYANEYKLRFIDAADGLPQADVKSIAQDLDGNYWICTNDGVARYDGKNFTPISIKNNDTPTNQSRIVQCDSDGDIWIGTLDNGLFMYDSSKETLEHISSVLNDENAPLYIYDIVIDERDNTLWIAGQFGVIYRLKVIDKAAQKFRLQQYTLIENDDSRSNPSCFILDKNGNPIAIKNRSAYRYNPDTDLFEPFMPELLGGLTLINTYNDQIYLLKGKTLYSHSIDSGKIIKISDATISRFFITSKGIMWLFGSNGIQNIDLNANNLSRSAKVVSTENLQILSIIEDSEGDVWAGMLRRGMLSISKNESPFESYINGHNTEALYEDQDGQIWLGSINGELRVMTPSGDNGYTIKRLDSLNMSKLSIFSITESALPNQYLICRSGISLLLDIETMATRSFKSSNNGQDIIASVRSTVVDSTYLWVASYTGGLLLYDTQDESIVRQFTPKSSELPLPSDVARSLMKDSNNNIWCATSEGLVRIDANGRRSATPSYKIYRHCAEDKNSISYNYVIPIAEGRDGTIWAGTLGGGLNALKVDDKGEVVSNKVYTTENGLSNNTIKAIVIDDQNIAWVTTNRGLNRIDPTDGSIEIYTPEDGLLSYEFSELSGTMLDSGKIAFGGVNGVNIFDPQSVKYGADRVRPKSQNKEIEADSHSMNWVINILLMAALVVAALYIYIKKRDNSELSTSSHTESTTQGSNEVPTPSISKADQQLLDEISRIIESNITDSTLSVETICDHLKMSKVTLNKRLKRAADKTANAYIRGVRMRYAAEMLSSGNYTIAETTYAIGLNDLRHFRESFKREFGVLPSEYVSAQRAGDTSSEKRD